jgi:hypothetical protein
MLQITKRWIKTSRIFFPDFYAIFDTTEQGTCTRTRYHQLNTSMWRVLSVRYCTELWFWFMGVWFTHVKRYNKSDSLKKQMLIILCIVWYSARYLSSFDATVWRLRDEYRIFDTTPAREWLRMDSVGFVLELWLLTCWEWNGNSNTFFSYLPHELEIP